MAIDNGFLSLTRYFNGLQQTVAASGAAIFAADRTLVDGFLVGLLEQLHATIDYLKGQGSGMAADVIPELKAFATLATAFGVEGCRPGVRIENGTQITAVYAPCVVNRDNKLCLLFGGKILPLTPSQTDMGICYLNEQTFGKKTVRLLLTTRVDGREPNSYCVGNLMVQVKTDQGITLQHKLNSRVAVRFDKDLNDLFSAGQLQRAFDAAAVEELVAMLADSPSRNVTSGVTPWGEEVAFTYIPQNFASCPVGVYGVLNAFTKKTTVTRKKDGARVPVTNNFMQVQTAEGAIWVTIDGRTYEAVVGLLGGAKVALNPVGNFLLKGADLAAAKPLQPIAILTGCKKNERQQQDGSVKTYLNPEVAFLLTPLVGDKPVFISLDDWKKLNEKPAAPAPNPLPQAA